ncbi:glycosyltransferase family 2 protein [Selenomonas ruminantium]|uniref:Glycosyltransferase 2-like domain-containing protein n=1 Tax=Selenomonas ruminantium TaxID=971 RepID=A0A1H0PQ36_SELRU|nr:glycosyltransferase family 2 protein [Selenomonas ruminantium]SDP06686.1 hypothetical protein SAMN05216366_105120 [Selenomonas ruminantium]
MKKVGIIVLNFNNPQDTIACLESIVKINYDNFVIVLIDNASTDQSSIILTNYISNIHDRKIVFIRSDVNKGYAGGNNIGLKYALEYEKVEYFWILNNDTLVTESSLRYLVEKMMSDKSIGVCGSKLLYEWDRNKLQGYGGEYNKWLGTNSTCLRSDEINKIDYVIGASTMISKDFLVDIGYLNEEYFLYYEELDWAERAKGKYRLDCAIDSIVYHKEGATSGGNYKLDTISELSDYFLIRNRIRFTFNYHKTCIPSVYLGLVYAMFNRLVRHQYTRIFMIFKLMFGIGTEKYEKMLNFLHNK